MKERGYQRPTGGFRPIHMPRNTGAGVILSAIAMVLGFAMIWYIWWLAALSFVAPGRRRDRPHLQLQPRLFRAAPTRWRGSRCARPASGGGGLSDGDRHRRRPLPDPTFYLVEAHDHEHGSGGGTLLGFWIYLMSDALMFATLFATFGVLSTSYAGGPTPREIFELPLVALNTAILLVSSITYGFAMLAMEPRQGAQRRRCGCW